MRYFIIGVWLGACIIGLCFGTQVVFAQKEGFLSPQPADASYENMLPPEQSMRERMYSTKLHPNKKIFICYRDIITAIPDSGKGFIKTTVISLKTRTGFLSDKQFGFK